MNAARIGDRAFERMEKMSGELFAITYGSLVRQLFVDCGERAEDVNSELDKIGFNIGIRLVDEYLARSGAPPCRNFVQTGEAIAKVGLKMFLGITANVENVAGDSYSITFEENPLNNFVDLPEQYRNRLWYSNVLCGVIRGALDMVNFKCDAMFVRDALRSDDPVSEIKVIFKELIKDQFKTDKD